MKNKKKYNEIFLGVVGITPQIITEIIYYYYHRFYNQNRYFDRIKVFTSLEGRDKIINTIFKNNLMKEMEKELDREIGQIPFNEADIIVFEDAKGQPIDDFRTTETNECAANRLYEEMKRWSDNPQNRITATVAGGRKTVSAAMALAFQLYAREQDELMHIMPPNEMMDPESEKSKTWFYPSDPKDPNQQLDVTLLPTLKIGRFTNFDDKLNPKDLADKIQEDIIDASPIDNLRIVKNSFYYNDECIKISPNLAAYLRFFIKRCIQSDCENYISNDDLLDAAKTDVLKEHEIILGKYSGHYERAKEARLNGLFNIELLNSHISELNKRIKSAEISIRFKNSLTIKSKNLDESDQRITFKGLEIKNNIVFED